MALEIAFLTAPGQSPFLGELIDVMRDELTALGVRSTVSCDGLPAPRAGLVQAIVAPHELIHRYDGVTPPAPLLARSVVLCAEAPGTAFFEGDAAVAEHAGAVFDVSPLGVAEWRRRGVAAERFVLGHTPRWTAPALDGPRDVDVAFLGRRSDRRDQALASLAPLLSPWRSRLVLTSDAHAGDDGFVGGDAKRELLRRSRVLLNVHYAEGRSFEALRVTEAILSGAVVVSEHGDGTAPLEPGAHFLSGRVEALGHLALEVLEDPALEERLRRDAFDRLLGHPLRAAVERFAQAAVDVDREVPVPRYAAWRTPLRPARPDPVPPPATEDPEAATQRRVLKQLRLDAIETRRRLARIEARLTAPDAPAVEVVGRTPAHAPARPRVSVLVTLFNYEGHIAAALDSVAASTLRETEIVVVDDGSSDGSGDRARAWLDAHPEVPAVLVGHRWNRGLPHARNTALDFARGELSFVLDADNALYPRGLERLVEALDADPGADFAYGIVASADAAGARGLLSVGAWDPRRLRAENPIDAMALFRTAALRQGGGYATDPRLHGWEDYDLWLRMAEEGRRGVAVEEIVGRYRAATHAMLRSLSALSTSDAYAVLIERHPAVMAGVAPPQ